MLLVLEPEDVARVLASTSAPFPPHGSPASPPRVRAALRRVNETALETDRPLHHLAPAVVGSVRREAAPLADSVLDAGEEGFGWDEFAAAWSRSVRRMVLGAPARDDPALSALTDCVGLAGLTEQRSLRPARGRWPRAALLRVRRHARVAESDTLAGALPTAGGDSGTDPAGQVPHWLSAFNSAGVVTLRTLALLATHPAQAARVRAELSRADLDRPQQLPLLRACVLESARLWPTAPLLLRKSTVDTRWRGAAVPAGTRFAVCAPYFHRAEPAGPHGDRFVPDLWLDGRARAHPALAPFGAGPGRCLGRELSLLTATTWLAALLDQRTYHLHAPVRPHSRLPLPAALDPTTLRFTARTG